IDVHDDRCWSRSASTTDTDGRAMCAGVLPGVVWIAVQAPEREDARFPFAVETGASMDAGTIELSRAVTLHGRVHRADGKPARGSVSYVALDRWRPGLPSSTDHFWGLDLEGRFELEGLGRGRYAVRYGDGESATPAQIVDTRRDPLPEVDLEPVAGTEVQFE